MKTNKPTKDPKVHEPEKQAPESEASIQNPENTANEQPPEILDTPVDPMNIDPSGTKLPSPTKPKEDAEDVLITGTGFVEQGNPTILAKHSAKEELIEKHKVKFDIANYSHLGVNELFSGYLSQLHVGRDLEVDIIKKMRQKYEV